MDDREAEEAARVLLREIDYHRRCVKDIDAKLAETSKKHGVAVALP